MTIFFEEKIRAGVKTLSEEESKHCSQVLRHQKGDKIMIFDGKGGKYYAVLTQVSVNTCEFDIIKSELELHKSFHVHLVIAPTKNVDRMEWMTEKLSEMGVDELTFIKTQHSERRKIRLDRLEKKAISAMKQSGNPFKLRINQLVHLRNFMDTDNSENKLIAHVNPMYPYLLSQIEASKKLSILIGPEGDFTIDELNFALEKNYQPVSLGKNTLRTETAGLIACSMINARNKY